MFMAPPPRWPDLQQALQAQQEHRVRGQPAQPGLLRGRGAKARCLGRRPESGLENEVKELDREIKDVRRTAAVAATLEEKLHWQKRQREMEDKRNQLRRRIFDRQDDIDSQRNFIGFRVEF
jgi:hypothetical protein